MDAPAHHAIQCPSPSGPVLSLQLCETGALTTTHGLNVAHVSVRTAVLGLRHGGVFMLQQRSRRPSSRRLLVLTKCRICLTLRPVPCSWPCELYRIFQILLQLHLLAFSHHVRTRHVSSWNKLFKSMESNCRALSGSPLLRPYLQPSRQQSALWDFGFQRTAVLSSPVFRPYASGVRKWRPDKRRWRENTQKLCNRSTLEAFSSWKTMAR